MKFCSHCGAQIEDDAVICVKCGRSTGGKTVQQEADAPSAGFSVLSFFIPLVGLILYLVWKDTYPLKAKGCGKWALIGFIVNICVSILYGIIVGVLLGSAMTGFASSL
ncbi:MAG: zinc-ribbon domain-containing protein [Eubacteriales bacterium]|nr:zinc-ribbon domain-containing protein [Eubacteriales bacterium]